MKGNSNHAIGLDVGTSRIVLAERSGERIAYQSQLNAFVSVPHSRLTAGVLEKENIPHTVEGDRILVHGNESEKLADLLNAETRRPMKQGVLDPREPESLTLMRQMVRSMAGEATPERRKVCFSVPAASLGSPGGHTYHEATLKQMLGELGWDARPIDEGLAVVYGEMEASNFTGIGVSCGGGLCNVCLAYLSVPVISFSIPKAGDYIDLNTASVTGERATRVRLSKEASFHFNGIASDRMQQVLGVYYDDLIRSLVTGLKEAFSHSASLPKFSRPIPLVLSGGSAMPAGFADRFAKLLWEQDFPIGLSEIRLAESPLHSTAKGALVCALSEM